MSLQHHNRRSSKLCLNMWCDREFNSLQITYFIWVDGTKWIENLMPNNSMNSASVAVDCSNSLCGLSACTWSAGLAHFWWQRVNYFFVWAAQPDHPSVLAKGRQSRLCLSEALLMGEVDRSSCRCHFSVTSTAETCVRAEVTRRGSHDLPTRSERASQRRWPMI